MRKERDSFEAQMTAVEQTMRAEGKDLEELALLRGDAALAKDAVTRDLAGAQQRLHRERKRHQRRQRDLSRKQQMAVFMVALLAPCGLRTDFQRRRTPAALCRDGAQCACGARAAQVARGGRRARAGAPHGWAAALGSADPQARRRPPRRP